MMAEQAKKEEKGSKFVENKDLVNLNMAVNSIENNGKLKVDAIIRIVKLKNCLKKKLEEYGEQQEELFKGYGLKSGDEGYTWVGHDKEDEIQEKSKQLNEAKVKIQPTKFLSEKELIECTKTLKIVAVEKLAEVLTEMF